MRLLRTAQVFGLARQFPGRWTSTGANPALVFEIPKNARGFVGVFLRGDPSRLAPDLTPDHGAGFNDLAILPLKPFARAFYHIPIGARPRLMRIRFRPGEDAAAFSLIAFTTGNAALVAALHYLFNLRHQRISALAARRDRREGIVSILRRNITRIAGFLRQISEGRGVEIQTSQANLIGSLILHMRLQVEALHAEPVSATTTAAPLISFVSPTFNTEVPYLDDLLASFDIQARGLCELILSDDGSTAETTLERLRRAEGQVGVKVLYGTGNQGISAATNAGLAAARGDWLSFIDHDDQLTPGAVAAIAQAIGRYPDADFFYTDEVVTDDALSPNGIFCKPTYDSVLLSGMNYINHLSIFRRSRVARLGGLRTDLDGSQDYDLLLRYLKSARPGSVVHIPYPAYLWRRHTASYSNVNIEIATRRARDALRIAYGAAGMPVEVAPALDPNLHRLTFQREAVRSVSVIIPNKNSLALITRIVDDLRARTDYPRLEIVVVDNGSDDPQVLRFYAELARSIPTARVDIVAEPFNFAAMCNRGARLATGEALLFLNNDIEVLTTDWLAEMETCLNFPETGIVGAKLLYPEGTIQHNGVIVGLGTAAGHWYVGEAANVAGPMGRFHVRQTLSAVTGACMLVSRACFEAVGGFDESAFPVAYNDVDLCLRARAAGFRTVWTPFACLTHRESATRGSDETGANAIRFKVEFARLQSRHGTPTYIDAAYSPLYDRRHSVPHLILPDALPAPRPNRFR